MVETTDVTLMSSLSLHLLRCMKKFREKRVLDVQLLCRVKKFFKRYIGGDSCFSPTVYARRLPGQEGEGDGTVIIMRIKEVESENCVSCCFGEDGRQRPGVAQNENFPCRRKAEAEGEGHQKHEAQSVNSPVRYIKVCCSPHPYPDTRRDSRSSLAKIEYSGEDKARASAKVDQIQHSYRVPGVAKLGTQHQVIRFNIDQPKHPEDVSCCMAESQHVYSGRRQDEDLVQEDDSDSVERRRHREPSTTNQYVSNVNISEVRREKSLKKCVLQKKCVLKNASRCVRCAKFLSRSTSILSTIL